MKRRLRKTSMYVDVKIWVFNGNNPADIGSLQDYTTKGFNLITGVPGTWDNPLGSDPGFDWSFPVDPFNRDMTPTPGPLMTSALAMFGKGSFFYVASNSSAVSYPPVTEQICQAGNIPFTRLDNLASSEMYSAIFSACTAINDPYYAGSDASMLDPMMYDWVSTFYPENVGLASNQTYSKEALEVAMFFANQHWLMETATATKELTSSARNIYSSTGLAYARPSIHLYGKITISILIALQLFGLAWLVKYIYSVPTWTEKLDSCAIAQLTHDVDATIFSRIKKPNEQDLKQLKDFTGIVGVVEENDEKHTGNELNGRNADANDNNVDTASFRSNTHMAASNEDGADRASTQSIGQKASSHGDMIEVASLHPNMQDVNLDEAASDAASAPLHKQDSPDASRSRDIDNDVTLVRGGTGIITKQHASFEEWKPSSEKWKNKFRKRKTTKESTLEKGSGA